MTATVVRAGPGDIGTIVTMRRALWPGDPEAHRAELTALMRRPTFAAFIARRDGVATGFGAAIGFAEATLREYVDGIDPGRIAYLEGLWTAEAARHRGVARLLLSAVEDWAAAEGCGHIGSDADADNPDGLGWHAALGFAEVGRTVNFARAIAKRGDDGIG